MLLLANQFCDCSLFKRLTENKKLNHKLENISADFEHQQTTRPSS